MTHLQITLGKILGKVSAWQAENVTNKVLDTPGIPENVTVKLFRISHEEKDYIEMAIKHASGEEKEESSPKVPWKDLFTCKAVWAVAAGHMASNWGNYQLNSMLPTYLASVLK